MSEIVYLNKATRESNARIFHANLVNRYAPKLRVSLGTYVRGGKLEEQRVRSAVENIFMAAAKKFSDTYGMPLDRNVIVKEATDAADDFLRTVQDGTKQGEIALSRLVPRNAPDRASRLRDGRGLDARSAMALENYRQRLELVGYSKSSIQDTVNRYRNELVRRRANLIAGTSTAKIVNRAHESLFLGTEDKYSKVWVLQKDPCPVCRKFAERVAAVGTDFGDGLLYPPVHPNCRCTFYVRLVG